MPQILIKNVPILDNFGTKIGTIIRSYELQNNKAYKFVSEKIKYY
jgi:hypothetical protein